MIAISKWLKKQFDAIDRDVKDWPAWKLGQSNIDTSIPIAKRGKVVKQGNDYVVIENDYDERTKVYLLAD